MSARRVAGNLDIVIVPLQQAVCIHIERLDRAVRGNLPGKGHLETLPGFALFAPVRELLRDNPWRCQKEGHVEVGPALATQFAVNVTATLAVIRTGIKGMNDGGRVIAVGASVADRVGTPGLADYAATRAAVVAWCKGAAHDVGARGITVNVVQLGAIDVALQGVTAQQLEAEVASNAMKRLGSAQEAAAAILFLAGPGASFITGTILSVDGGYMA